MLFIQYPGVPVPLLIHLRATPCWQVGCQAITTTCQHIWSASSRAPSSVGGTDKYLPFRFAKKGATNFKLVVSLP